MLIRLLSRCLNRSFAAVSPSSSRGVLVLAFIKSSSSFLSDWVCRRDVSSEFFNAF
jgi:hypothetical protein